MQPPARFAYVENTLAVDAADQRNAANVRDHRPLSFYWRRVVDHNLSQCCTNAHLLGVRWVKDRLAVAERTIAQYLVGVCCRRLSSVVRLCGADCCSLYSTVALRAARQIVAYFGDLDVYVLTDSVTSPVYSARY